MAVTLRARTTAVDNIAVGSATGTERTTGDTPPAQKVGGKDNIAVGSVFPTAVIADNQLVGVTTILKERVSLT